MDLQLQQKLPQSSPSVLDQQTCKDLAVPRNLLCFQGDPTADPFSSSTRLAAVLIQLSTVFKWNISSVVSCPRLLYWTGAPLAPGRFFYNWFLLRGNFGDSDKRLISKNDQPGTSEEFRIDLLSLLQRFVGSLGSHANQSVGENLVECDLSLRPIGLPLGDGDD